MVILLEQSVVFYLYQGKHGLLLLWSCRCSGAATRDTWRAHCGNTNGVGPHQTEHAQPMHTVVTATAKQRTLHYIMEVLGKWWHFSFLNVIYDS